MFDSEVKGVLDQLQSVLAHHTEREEAGLFDTLRQVEVGPQYMDLFEHDHGHLVELIESARRDRGTVDDLIQGFEVHMLREENDMFPAAEQLLSPSRLGRRGCRGSPPAEVASETNGSRPAYVRSRAADGSNGDVWRRVARSTSRAGSARTSLTVPSSRR